MMRHLVKLQQLVGDLESEGLDLDQVYVDPDDAVVLEQDEADQE